jgi:tRNA A-37 threonylcarbamoyl transferase component Bud32
MSLPRLRADVHGGLEVARVLRAALRHQVQTVPLAASPTGSGQHLLEVEVPGEASPVTVLADPVGSASAEGFPLQLRPVTRPQMAVLLALVERLDVEPSNSEPPSAAAGDDDDEWDGPPGADSTMVDAMDSIVLVDAFHGFPEEDLPSPASGAAPPSSDKDSAPPPPLSRMPSSAPVPAGPLRNVIGSTIAGKYRVDAPIGSGSTAAVFRAMHLDLRRPVAIKILHEKNLGEVQFVKRFKAEARAASKLEHLNVARVTDFGQEPSGLLYIVMELLEGRSLEAILAAEGWLPQRKAADIAIQACSALAFAHDIGIIHRDVKPENIMLVQHRDDDGNPCDLVKVCDFGLAKLRDPDPENVDLTLGGMLCGSPAYMSPEQTRGETLDARTDIYSLGVTLFESLTGHLPHDGHSIAELFTKKITEPPKKPSSIVAGIDPLLEDVVLRAVATDPKVRHATARVFREELRAALAQLEDEPESEAEGTIIAD